MVDFSNNYKNITDEVKNDDYLNIQTDQNQKFAKIKNIAELPHKNITQPRSNKFYILINDLDLIKVLYASIIIGLCSGCLFAFLYIGTNHSSKINLTLIFYYILTGLTGLIFVLSFLFIICCIALLIITFKAIKITLDVDGIEIIKIHYCSCCHKKQIFRTGEIKRFDIKIEKKNETEIISIIYYDSNNNEKLLTRNFFYEDEAKYLMYILNNYLQGKNSNYITPITPY